jgi:hypothetical protein
MNRRGITGKDTEQAASMRNAGKDRHRRLFHMKRAFLEDIQIAVPAP